MKTSRRAFLSSAALGGAAAKTQHAIYDMAAADHLPVLGYHFAFSSIGHVERAGAGYRLVPIAWQAAL